MGDVDHVIGHVIGIDIGVDTVAAAAVDHEGSLRSIRDDDGHEIHDSVVAFRADGNVDVGQRAATRIAEDPNNTLRLCDLVGGATNQTRAGRFTAQDVYIILFDYLRQLAETQLGGSARSAVIVVPMSADDAVISALRSAAHHAHIQIESCVPTPIAASVAAGHTNDPHGRAPTTQAGPLWVVCDFGATHFECTVLTYGETAPRVVGNASTVTTCGHALVQTLCHQICEEIATQSQIDLRDVPTAVARVAWATEQMLRQLPMAGSYGVQLDIPSLAILANGQEIAYSSLFTAERVQTQAHTLLQHAEDVCNQALKQAGVGANDISDVIGVGGMWRQPWLRAHFANVFGRSPRMDLDVQTIAAQGAALLGSPRSVIQDRITGSYGRVASPPAEQAEAPTIDASSARIGRVVTKKMFTAVMDAVTPQALGELSEHEDADVSFSQPLPAIIDATATTLAISTVGGFCDEIIPHSTPLPSRQTHVFSTAKDNQQDVRLNICQGNSRKFVDNIALGTLILDQLPPRPRGQLKIAVTFEIDLDGSLQATAREEGSGQEQSIRLQLLT